MKREEEILKAARFYIGDDMLSSSSIVFHFKTGAEWTDEHPNLESLWHDASEEPQGDNWRILCVDDFDLFWVMSKDSWLYSKWDEYVEIEGVKTWAYISDLLPKQFGNSERLKGGEK